jgi:hypothetical protein
MPKRTACMETQCSSCNHANICAIKDIYQNAVKEVGALNLGANLHHFEITARCRHYSKIKETPREPPGGWMPTGPRRDRCVKARDERGEINPKN